MKINLVKCVYQIKSKQTNDIYIGSTQDFVGRKAIHLWYFRNNKHTNYFMQDHVNLYGIDDLEFEIIEKVDGDIKARKEREQSYLDILNPYFNICKKANSTAGRPTPESVKIKQSLVKKGIKPCGLAYQKSFDTCAKQVFNLETGIFYDSIREAAESINIGRHHLRQMLSNVITNKTNFVLAEIGHKVAKIFKKRKHTIQNFSKKWRTVLNKETGIYYQNIREAATAHNLNHGTLANMLNPNSKNRNNTNLIFA